MKILKMNIANKLTLLRLFLVPVFIISYEIHGVNSIIPGLIFVLTAATDFFDGHLARKYDLVTTFGKFMDPLVDKVLTQAGFILLASSGHIPAWTVIVIIFRELLITGLRTLAASNNVTIAASVYGKLKTVSQFVAITAFLLKGSLNIPSLALDILLYISVAMTIISGIDYLYKNKEVLDLDNM